MRESNIKLGDTVLVKQPKANKLSTPFNPVPFVVEEKKGSMITASDGHKTVTRNSSMFKVVPSHIEHTGNHTQEMDQDVSANPQPLEIQELDKITKAYCRPTTITKADKASREIRRLRIRSVLVQEN